MGKLMSQKEAFRAQVLDTDAVNGLFERGEFPCDGTVPMFHLAVVFKKGVRQ